MKIIGGVTYFRMRKFKYQNAAMFDKPLTIMNKVGRDKIKMVGD